jgi:mutator family transposase
MDDAEADVLAFMSFPKDHCPKIHSINPLERLNGEIKRRTDVVGIFPDEDANTRPIGALLLEQNDEWTVQRGRYMSLETIVPLSDDPIVKLNAASRSFATALLRERAQLAPPCYTTPGDLTTRVVELISEGERDPYTLCRKSLAEMDIKRKCK